LPADFSETGGHFFGNRACGCTISNAGALVKRVCSDRWLMLAFTPKATKENSSRYVR
jgi:hypothetical protein